MELLDDNQMRTINAVDATPGKKWEEKPTLFIKFAGTKSGVKESIQTIRELAKESNAIKFEFARNDAEKKQLWSARKVQSAAMWADGLGSVTFGYGIEGGGGSSLDD
jgi:D-lactate dehydrogenase (cytochrome)